MYILPVLRSISDVDAGKYFSGSGVLNKIFTGSYTWGSLALFMSFN